MSHESHQQNVIRLEQLFSWAKSSRGVERYKAYEDVCDFLLDVQLWKTDTILKKQLEELLDSFLTKEIPTEIEKAQNWVYDPELILAIYNDPELEIVLYSLQHTMTLLKQMMQ